MASPVAPASCLSTSKHRPAALDRRYIGDFVDELFGKTLHEKRLESLSNSVVGEEIVVALDWTDFERDDHTPCAPIS
jgi:hypothetical protein